MLTRLRYASRLVSGTTSSDIDEIVEKAAIRNRERGITGVLAIDGDKVLQILEGPEHEVEILFQKIAADSRHDGVVDLDRISIESAQFTDWGMVRRSMASMLLMTDTV